MVVSSGCPRLLWSFGARHDHAPEIPSPATASDGDDPGPPRLCDRFDRCPMGDPANLLATGPRRGPAPHHRLEGGPQRDPLCAADRLWLALAAPRFPTPGDGLWLLPPMAPGRDDRPDSRRLAADRPRSLRARPRALGGQPG